MEITPAKIPYEPFIVGELLNDSGYTKTFTCEEATQENSFEANQLLLYKLNS